MFFFLDRNVIIIHCKLHQLALFKFLEVAPHGGVFRRMIDYLNIGVLKCNDYTKIRLKHNFLCSCYTYKRNNSNNYYYYYI